MDARFFRVPLRACAVLSLIIALADVSAAQRFANPSSAVGSRNFVVFASNKAFAEQVAQAAEQYRRDLAMHWLGHELPPWRQRCPLHVHDHPNAPASGETQFRFNRGAVVDWQMMVQGTQERILDSVLPHEISHTVFATHFAPMNKYMPRWADEGACTTVEHEAEKRKHRHYLKEYLLTGRGLPFNLMFRLKEYPDDILPLYAQGHSAVQFLITQAGPQQFIKFVETGMASENWGRALNSVYAYDSIGDFQINWNQWIEDGSPSDLTAYAPLLRSGSASTAIAASTPPAGSLNLVSSAGGALGSSNTVSHSKTANNPTGKTRENPVQFAIATRELSASGEPTGGAPMSWYSRRLTEVTGEQPPRFNGRPNGQPIQPIPTSRVARPSSTQSVQVSVQQWGQGGVVPGIDRQTQASLPAGPPRTTNPQANPTGAQPNGGAPSTEFSSSRSGRLFGPPTGNWRY